MSQYKISMIVPIYNAEKYLERAIKSVINQSIGFENIELILVDDNSKDNSREIVQKYSNQYDNIVPIFLTQNSGFGGKPRNIGVERSTAKYLMFLDNDDIYLKNACKDLFDAIEETSSEIVLANYYLKSDDEIIKNQFCPKKYGNLTTFNPTSNQETFDLITNMTCMAPWAKIYDSEFIKKNNFKFPIDTQFDDAVFYVDLLMQAENMTVLPDTFVYCYHEFEDSLIRHYDKKKFDSFFLGLKGVDNILNKNSKISNIGFLKEHLQSLLLIFSNSKVSKNEKIEMLNEIYDFEVQYDDIKLNNSELSLMNNAIMSHNFKRAIMIADFYSFLYNNRFIKNIYRKLNNFKRK